MLITQLSLLHQHLQAGLVSITFPPDFLDVVLPNLQPMRHVVLQQKLQNMLWTTLCQPATGGVSQCMLQHVDTACCGVNNTPNQDPTEVQSGTASLLQVAYAVVKLYMQQLCRITLQPSRTLSALSCCLYAHDTMQVA